MPADPDVTVAAPGPVSPNPNRVRSWPDYVAPTHPGPAPSYANGPIPWRPGIFRPRGYRHDFDLRRGRRFGSYWSVFRRSCRPGDRRRRRSWNVYDPTLDTPGAQGRQADCWYGNPCKFHILFCHSAHRDAGILKRLRRKSDPSNNLYVTFQNQLTSVRAALILVLSKRTETRPDATTISSVRWAIGRRVPVEG